MILIIAEDNYDDMSVALFKVLKEKSADVQIIQQSKLPSEYNITLFVKDKKLSGELIADNKIIQIRDINAIYTRLGVCGLNKKLPKSVKNQIEIERQICTNMMFEHIDAMVINRTKSQFFNSSKLFQSFIIKNYGFKIPDSIVSNDPNEVRAFIDVHKEIIYKSASSERSKVQKIMPSDMEKLDLLRSCPHLFQQHIDGCDIRVHALATGEVFACEIKSETSDYRYDNKRNINIINLPDKIKKACVKMTLDMGLYLSGIDLRKTKEGNYYCFEVNPSPAFTWYEMQTGLPIAEAVANMMINSGKYKQKAIRKY